MSNRTLFVGRIPIATTQRELEELFSQHGETGLVQIMTDHRTGQARGFAFVEMVSQVRAEEITRELNGYILGGVPLTVVLATPRH